MQDFDIVRSTNHCGKTLSPTNSSPNNLPRWISISLALLCLVIFAVPSPAQTYTMLTSLVGTGLWPGTTPLVQGFDGSFYGVSELGGANSRGAIYKVTPAGVLTVLHNFCPEIGCADGSSPSGLTLGKDGNFYGSTYSGGTVIGAASGDGTIFKITPQGVLTTLYSFCGRSCRVGQLPGPLVQAPNGSFFGTAINGGRGEHGSIFEVTAKGAFTALYNFCTRKVCADGSDPSYGLALGVDGDLYGTTTNTFFKMTEAGKLTVLYTFCVATPCVDGSGLVGVPIQAADGNLYGTTEAGGSQGGGTIYQITTDGQFTTLYSFCHKANCPNGSVPFAGLALGSDGNFYGTTNYGGNRYVNGCGDQGCGTIFQSNSSGALTTIYKFCAQPKCGDGLFPMTPIVQGTDGSFYGMAGGGTRTGFPIYKLDTGLPPFVKTLPASGGANATVIILGNNLTGTTEVAFNGVSAVFKVVSDTEITAKVPSGASTGSVTVTTQAGTLSSNIAFNVP
jgi:uncharacterized repeat protein (TIGR03803 family)